MNRFSRLLVLTLCLLLAANPALASGMRFTIRASIHSDAFPADQQPLCAALSGLLEAAQLEGAFVSSGSAFTLNATLLMGQGDAASRTTCRIFGTHSHWGVQSSLLGDTELMVNCAALLPFGQKARSYLGLPLDAAALLVPYTHVNAFASVSELLAPLFPAEDGKVTLSRAEMDALAREISRLLDEDPALNLWLNTTGLYGTARRICSTYFTIPELLLPSLTARRSGGSLTWKSGLITLLSVQEKDGGVTCEFALPTLASISASLQQDGDRLSLDAAIQMDSLQATVSASMPIRLTPEGGHIRLKVDAVSAILPDGELHLLVEGETHGNAVALRFLNPDTSAALLSLEGTLIPTTPDALPAYTHQDLTGVNILSINSDSLRALLDEVKWPLLTGLFDLVVAAPAPAVQTLMDYCEDSGLIDLMSGAISGY